MTRICYKGFGIWGQYIRETEGGRTKAVRRATGGLQGQSKSSRILWGRIRVVAVFYDCGGARAFSRCWRRS